MSAQAQAPLLLTKLNSPDPRERIGREVLVARLSDAHGARLALIRAPDPIRFWAYALEALRTVDPELGTRSLTLLQAPGVDLVNEMLPVLIGELDAFGRPLGGTVRGRPTRAHGLRAA